MIRSSLFAAVLVSATVVAHGPVAAEAQQSFAGRTITLTIGYGPGSGNDVYGRLVARHLGKHLPGQPAVVAQNMPGAGSFKAAVPDGPKILLHNVYGWFDRVERGVYRLTSDGAAALARWPQPVAS